MHIGVLWSLCYVNTHRVKLFMFLCSGNIGTELSSTNLGMFITSDAGNSWRQVGLHTARVYLKQIMDSCWKRVCHEWSKCVFFLCAPIQIFDEEHNVWFLDNGGALLAVLHAATPIRHLW